MKKLVIVLILSCLFTFGCKNPEEQAKDAEKQKQEENEKAKKQDKYFRSNGSIPIFPDKKIGLFQRVYLEEDKVDYDAVIQQYLLYGFLIGLAGVIIAIALKRYGIPGAFDCAIIGSSMLIVCLLGLWWYVWIKAILSISALIAAGFGGYLLWTKINTASKLQKGKTAFKEVVKSFDIVKKVPEWTDAVKLEVLKVQSDTTIDMVEETKKQG